MVNLKLQDLINEIGNFKNYPNILLILNTLSLLSET